MAKNENMLAESGMKFFGKITASATHEIKNTLAIINENAGLLEDLSMMAEKGIPLSFERVKNISQKVTKQVQRTDFILKKLNRFSHSVDLSTQMTDLGKTTYFVLDLASRLIEMQEIVVEVTPPSGPMIIDTKLFYLENMIWRAIETACSATPGKSRVLIAFGTSTSPGVWFSTDADKNDFMDNLFESEQDKSLIKHLDISIEKNYKNKSFGLIWPKRI